MKAILKFLILALFLSLISCSDSSESLFKLKTNAHTGIDFTNSIQEDSISNIAFFAYMYNGGGVGIADVNNDGLEDIYFTGNQVSGKLYLNKGDLKFEDITKTAGVETDRWTTGVSMVDVNADGWTDIYISATDIGDGRPGNNLLYINKGINTEGEITFVERALEYGIDDPGFTVQSAFFDYDLDGDLDMYLLRNYLEKFPQNTIRPIDTTGKAKSNDKLFRNDMEKETGAIAFTEVTLESGIVIEGYGLGIAISDINLDGWPDIYIANDFISSDHFYINQQDGTFINYANSLLKHQSRHGMGVDIADYNNDALSDIMVLDMLPEDPMRQKQMGIMLDYDYVKSMTSEGYDLQYVRNTLQLNNGFIEGQKSFSEIGQLAGIHKTDWSWSTLFADFDNDGLKDIYITNGFVNDITDLDYISYGDNSHFARQKVSKGKVLETIKSLPEIRLSNYGYKNNGDLTFTDQTEEWGIDRPSISNGAAYSDLDNDGDLDLIVNNINEPAFVFENRTLKNNYIQLQLIGSNLNPSAYGSKVIVESALGRQYLELFPQRGYQSSTGNTLHFGLSKDSLINKISVTWPDGTSSHMYNVEPNQRLNLEWNDKNKEKDTFHNVSKEGQEFLKPFNGPLSPQYLHQPYEFGDFYYERLLPQKYSVGGPGIAVGDIDSNGLDDFFIGSDHGEKGAFFLQLNNGQFTRKDFNGIAEDVKGADMGVLFFDCDGDQDLDLYVVSGGNIFHEGDAKYQDRIYMNDGNANFRLAKDALPEIVESGSSVCAADWDGDGDLDLFVGGRNRPRSFPLSPKSYFLENRGGRFKDVTEKMVGTHLLGMVSQAIWSDFNDDLKVDLIVCGEYMPITFYENQGESFKEINKTGIEEYHGFWTSIVGGDFDNDGDTDYIAGNLGDNNPFKPTIKEPIELFVDDFDRNSSIDPIMSYYANGKRVPFINRTQLIEQLPMMKKRFTDYLSYSSASINEVLNPDEIQNAQKFRVTWTSSSYIENMGDGTFRIKALPIRAQFSNVYGMLVHDFNKDENLDLLLCGNNYGPAVQIGQYDASNGNLLIGDGNGGFNVSSWLESGFFLRGDSKAMSMITNPNGESFLLVSQNSDSLKSYKWKEEQNPIKIPEDIFRANVKLKNGKVRKEEFYFGNGYLSQNSRYLISSATKDSVLLYSYSGEINR